MTIPRNLGALAIGADTSGVLATTYGGIGTSNGALTNTTVDGTNAVGFKNIPINSQSANYTTVLEDSGKVIFHPSSDDNARTFTIPANSSVAYASGTALTFINMSAQDVTIAITTDTMYLTSTGSTSPKVLAQYGSATALKMTATTWLISGSELSSVLVAKAIFGFGSIDGAPYLTSITNLVSNTGVVASDTAGVGVGRESCAAAGYGTDKAIFGYGYSSALTSITSLVANTGVVSADVTGVGTARNYLAATGYGTDKAIFGYGEGHSITNLVSNTGVVSANTTGVGTARYGLAAARYGSTGQALFGFGYVSAVGSTAVTNLVSNTGVVASDTAGVGTARYDIAAASYGTDKAIFGYGSNGNLQNITNLVSNTGVVSANVTGVGTARASLAAAGYGVDTAIFGYGGGGGNPNRSMTNLVSNTGVVSSDVTGVGTVRMRLAAASYGLG